jgi:hypothetical protein
LYGIFVFIKLCTVFTQQAILVYHTAISTSFLLNNQTDALKIPILFYYKTVSCIFSAHHQEFSTAHSALVSSTQVFDDRFQAESGWNCSSILTLLESGHQKPARNLPVPNVQYKTPDDGQRRCTKHVEFYNRIKLGFLARLFGYLKRNLLVLRCSSTVLTGMYNSYLNLKQY